MQVNILQLWRNRTLVESVSSLSLKRFDTNPEPAIEVLVNGDPFSLIGTGIRGRMRFTVTLTRDVVTDTTRITTTRDLRVRVDDVLVINSERMKVTKVDAVSDASTLRLTVERAQDNTTAAFHETGSIVSVMIVERVATIITSGNGNRCYLPLQAGDTERSGSYEVEFEVTESTGGKFTIPASPVVVTVSDDFEGA